MCFWCAQWEIFSTVDSDCQLLVALSAVESAAFHKALVDDFGSIALSMSKIDTRRAAAFHERDREMIEAAVRSSPGGFEAVNGRIHDCLRAWLASEGRRALEMRRATLGDEHNVTVKLMVCLAILLREQGKLSEAEPLCREALRVGQETLGEAHPNTLGSLNNLAILLSEQGKLSEAEPLHRKALCGLQETLGEAHPDTLSSLNNLASLLKDQGKLSEAEPLYREALRVRQETLGEAHPDTLTPIGNLVQD